MNFLKKVRKSLHLPALTLGNAAKAVGTVTGTSSVISPAVDAISRLTKPGVASAAVQKYAADTGAKIQTAQQVSAVYDTVSETVGANKVPISLLVGGAIVYFLSKER